MRLATTLKCLAASLVLAASMPATATAGVVNFDDTAAPGLYISASPLSDHYAAIGLVFSGATAVGGAILNQSAELGFPALSGTDFLAFNIGGGTGRDERIVFASEQDTVAIHAATYEEGTFSMTAYDAAGNVLDFVSQAATREWQALTLTHAGIRSVVVASTTGTFGLDDLSFEGALAPVPEPASLMLMGVGLAGLLGMRRRG